MSARYAIYYAPQARSALWAKACAWLGRDAYSGETPARPALPGLEGLDFEALTADPRGYGFHATLKAPFALAADKTEAELLTFARCFAAGLTPFRLAIAPASLGRFLAFRIEGAAPAMDALHTACVREFEPFRAPLSAVDLERRRKAALSPEQDARLAQWGYPYVFEDFRFHMTLTSSIRDEALHARVLGAMKDYFAAETGPHDFDGVAVFKQPTRDAPFDILDRFGFEAAVAGVG